jgi:hypothetical protein
LLRLLLLLPQQMVLQLLPLTVLLPRLLWAAAVAVLLAQQE